MFPPEFVPDDTESHGFESVLHNSPRPEDDVISDFDPLSYPDILSSLYIIPTADTTTFQVLNPDSYEENSQIPEPEKFEFRDLLDFRYFCDKPPIDLNNYFIVMPASKYRNIRVDIRRRSAQTFPIYLAKIPA